MTDQRDQIPSGLLAIFFLVLFGVLGGLAAWLIPGNFTAVACLVAGATLAALCVAPAFVKAASPVVMAVLFVAIAPLALIARLGDPLRFRLGRVKSYWQDHPADPPTIQRMQRPN